MTNLRLETEEQVQRAHAQARMHRQKAAQSASVQVRGGNNLKPRRARGRSKSPKKTKASQIVEEICRYKRKSLIKMQQMIQKQILRDILCL